MATNVKTKKEQNFDDATAALQELGFKSGLDYHRVTWGGVPCLAFAPLAVIRLTKLAGVNK